MNSLRFDNDVWRKRCLRGKSVDSIYIQFAWSTWLAVTIQHKSQAKGKNISIKPPSTQQTKSQTVSREGNNAVYQISGSFRFRYKLLMVLCVLQTKTEIFLGGSFLSAYLVAHSPATLEVCFFLSISSFEELNWIRFSSWKTLLVRLHSKITYVIGGVRRGLRVHYSSISNRIWNVRIYVIYGEYINNPNVKAIENKWLCGTQHGEFRRLVNAHGLHVREVGRVRTRKKSWWSESPSGHPCENCLCCSENTDTHKHTNVRNMFPSSDIPNSAFLLFVKISSKNCQSRGMLCSCFVFGVQCTDGGNNNKFSKFELLWTLCTCH